MDVNTMSLLARDVLKCALLGYQDELMIQKSFKVEGAEDRLRICEALLNEIS